MLDAGLVTRIHLIYLAGCTYDLSNLSDQCPMRNNMFLLEDSMYKISVKFQAFPGHSSLISNCLYPELGPPSCWFISDKSVDFVYYF